MNARDAVLGRIEQAVAGSVPVAVPRDYERADLTGPGDVALFAETVGDYRAQVFRVAASEVAATVASLLRGARRVVTPAGLDPAWTAGLAPIVDGEPALLSVGELDEGDAVVTGCRLGIAKTGTIVLDAGPGQGRRLVTLVPDRHVCIVRADQVVDTVPQAFARLVPGRPLTFVSGPSATSDIELDRVEGVHGPRTLDVILVEPE